MCHKDLTGNNSFQQNCKYYKQLLSMDYNGYKSVVVVVWEFKDRV